MNPLLWACGLSIAIAVVARPKPPVRVPGRGPVRDPVATDPTASRPQAPPRRTRQTVRAARPGSTTEVAEWCEGLARAVRGGDSIASAIANTPPPAGHAVLLDRVTRNLERTGTIGDVATEAPSDLALVLAVVAACVEHGGPAAEPLDRAAGVLRARAADHADRQIHSAQARLSAQVLTVLPAAMLALLLASSASVRSTIATPHGVVLVTIGAALNLAGWRWMSAVIQRAAR